MTIEIRPAGPGDIDDMAQFWHRHMNRSLSPEHWRRILSYPWLADAPDRGWLATDAGEVVACLGLIYSTRMLGATERMCNMSSIYVRKDHRRTRVALEMLARATANPDCTYCVFNAQPGSRAVIETPEVGFEILDDRRYVWTSHHDYRRVPGVDVLHRSASIRDRLDAGNRRLYDDHVPLGVEALWAACPQGEMFALLWRRKKATDVVYHEVLFVDRPEILAAHAQEITTRVIAPDEVLAADARFFGRPPPRARVEEIALPRHCKSSRVPPSKIDLLYSEVPLLGLKLS